MACSSCYNCGGSPCTTCGGYTPPPPPPPYVCPDPQPCDTAMDAECVLYTGDDLTCIGVTDIPKSVSSILVSLDQLLCQIGAGVTYITSTNCIELDGDGTQGNPLQAVPRINPTTSNLLQCTSGGLSTYLNIDDSECISLSGAGTVADPLIASPILDPDPDNLLSCGPDGLLVTGSTVEIADTNCINLSGNGTVASPLTAAPIISSTAGNILSCTANGLLSKLNVNTAAGCVALSGDGTSGSPLAVSLTINSTLQCTSGTLGINPASIPSITANNGLTMSTSTNVQLGGTLVQNTNVSLSGFTLTLKDTGAVPTGLEIIPGALDDTDWNTSTATNLNIFTGRLLSQNISRFNTNVGIGVDPSVGSTTGARLNVYKSYASSIYPTTAVWGSNVELTFNDGVQTGSLTSTALVANNVKLSFITEPTSGLLSANGSSETRYSATHTEFVFGVKGSSTVTTNGKMSALSSRLYFIYNSDVADEIITNRIMSPVHDGIQNYTGTIDTLTGLKIDNLRTDSTIDSATTKTYAIRQMGVDDENRYQGPTYHVNNVGIGTTPEYTYSQGARLRVYSDDYTLPNTGQSSLALSINDMKLYTAASTYNVGRVVTDINNLELAFNGNGNSGAGSQSLASSGNWAAGFSYLRFSTGRTVTGTAAANSVQCNFITNIVNLTNCSGSGTTITCDSTAGLYVGQELYVIGGTGGWASTPTVASIINSVSFTVSAAPSVALSSATIQAKYDGTMGTVVGYRAMSPIADAAIDFNGTIAESIGILIEDQTLIGSGTITNQYGIVQGSISNVEKGKVDVNIINAEVNIFRNLPVYANEAAAVTGGLATGTIYQTATGELRIKL